MHDTSQAPREVLNVHPVIGWTLIAVVLVNLFVYALAFWSLHQSRQQYEDQAEMMTGNLAQTLDGDISGLLDRVNASLVAVEGELEQQLTDGTMDPARLKRFIAVQRENVSGTFDLRVTDAAGMVRYGSGVTPEMLAAVGDLDFFKSLHDSDISGVVIGELMQSRISGKWVMVVARRYTFPDGRFAGIVLSPIPVEYFVSVFSSLHTGIHDAISLRNGALAVIARYPEDKEGGGSTGNNEISDTLRKLLQDHPEYGTYKAVVKIDRIERVISYRKIGRFPLYIFVGQAQSGYLAGWRKDAMAVSVAVVAFTAVSLLMAWQLYLRWLNENRTTFLLKKSEERYRNLVENSPIGIYQRYVDGKYIYVNSHLAHQFLCRDASEFFERYGNVEQRWSNREKHNEFRELLLKEKKVSNYEVESQLVDGSFIWSALFCTFDPENSVIEGWAIDITAAKRATRLLEQSEERFSKAFNSSPGPMSISDIRTGLFIDVNEKLLQMIERTREETIGHTSYQLGIWAAPSVRVMLGEKVENTGFVKDEPVKFITKSGIIRDTLWSAEKINIAGSDAMLSLIYDVTESNKAGEEIRRLNDELRHEAEILEQRVAARTAELVVARDRAQSADRMKSAFLATMSHELRTPLNSIIGFTGIMLQGLTGPLNPEQRKQMGMVQNSSRHLLSLINDILDISKIEAGQLSLSPESFDLRESLEKMVRLISPLADKKGIALRLDIADTAGSVTADPRRLEQVFLNLLSNAVKFTDTGHIHVVCREDDGGYCLSFADTGIGMRQEDLAGIFQPFHQIDTGLSRKCEGTGLGLSICRKILDLMGGSIEVESQWNSGSTFTVRIPKHPLP